uniref:Uncharacterized protein n=1 Tax=Arundo donax TaxID=35708 RepID=A0A0A9A303_ARUDO
MSLTISLIVTQSPACTSGSIF